MYWLHCKNRKFYVIPEKELIEHGYIGKYCKQHLYVSPTNSNTEWCNKYLFDYDNVEIFDYHFDQHIAYLNADDYNCVDFGFDVVIVVDYYDDDVVDVDVDVVVVVDE